MQLITQKSKSKVSITADLFLCPLHHHVTHVIYCVYGVFHCVSHIIMHHYAYFNPNFLSLPHPIHSPHIHFTVTPMLHYVKKKRKNGYSSYALGWCSSVG